MLLPKQVSIPHRHWYIVFCTVTLVVGVFVSIYAYIRVDQANRLHIIDRTNTIAQAIPAGAIAELSGDERDLTNPTYLAIKKLLLSIRGVNHDARFLYVIGKNKAGELFFYADSENANSLDYSPPGQIYSEAPLPMYETFSEGVSNTDGPTRDRWGIWVSGYSPIFDSSGSVVALLGMDIPGRQHIFTSLIYSGFTFLLTVVFLLVMASIQYNRKKEIRFIEQKSEFLSIAAHEIRTPLTGIRWALENLLTSSKAPLDTSTAGIIYLAESNTARLIERINNLLTVTRLENGATFKLHREPVDLGPLLREIVNSLILTAQGRGITVELENKLPEGITLPGDTENLRYALSNIISNAIKYTHPNTPILVQAVATEKTIGVRISDKGPGIPPDEQQHIFDGYHRAKEAIASGQTGTGLGLYLTKKIITLHKGTIEVISHMGTGTTFICTFPRE